MSENGFGADEFGTPIDPDPQQVSFSLARFLQFTRWYLTDLIGSQHRRLFWKALFDGISVALQFAILVFILLLLRDLTQTLDQPTLHYARTISQLFSQYEIIIILSLMLLKVGFDFLSERQTRHLSLTYYRHITARAWQAFQHKAKQPGAPEAKGKLTPQLRSIFIRSCNFLATLTRMMVNVIPSVIKATCALLLCFYLDVLTTLIVFASGLMFLPASIFMQRKIYHNETDYAREQAEMPNHVSKTMQHVLSQDGDENRQYAINYSLTHKAARVIANRQYYQSLHRLNIALFMALFLALMLYLLVSRTNDPNELLSNIIVYILSMRILYTAMADIVSKLGKLVQLYPHIQPYRDYIADKAG